MNIIPNTKVLVTAITNVLDPNALDKRIVEYIDYEHGLRVKDYFNKVVPFLGSDWEYLVTINGLVIREEDLPYYNLNGGDNVAFAVIPKSGGGEGSGKSVLRIVGVIVIMVAAYFTYGASLKVMPAWLAMFAASAVASVGMYALNAVLPPYVPDMSMGGSVAGNEKDSPNYGWSVQDNVDLEGAAWPILYGTMRVFPPIVAKHITVRNNKQYLNILFGLADHALDFIDNVEINDNPSTNYSGITIDKRYGTYSQNVISSFRDTLTEYSVQKKLKGIDWKEYAIPGNTTEGIVLGLTCPYGIWYAEDDGSLGYNKITFDAEYRLSGESWTPWLTHEAIREKTRSTIRKTYRIDGLPAGSYELRVSFSVIPPTGTRYGSDVYFDFCQSVVPDNFRYPGRSLLAVKLLATDQLSGGRPRVSVKIKRNNVPVWTGVSWENKSARNPAWASYDLHVNDEYSAGVDKDRMIYNDFNNWATFCTNNNLECDLYPDTFESLPTQLNKLGLVGRGQVVQRGTNFGCIMDDVETPTALFNTNNIIENTLQEFYIEDEDRANVIEVSYKDKDLNYNWEVAELRTDDFDTATNIKDNKANIKLHACTDRSVALAHAQFRLNYNKYIERMFKWKSDIDAINCTLNDVVWLSRDLATTDSPPWGESGRIEWASSNSAALSNPVTMESGKNYQILVRHSADDTLEFATAAFYAPQWITATFYSKDICVEETPISTPFNYKCIKSHTSDSSNQPGIGVDWETYWEVVTDLLVDIITLSGTWTTTPSQYDLFSFGEVNKVARKVRIVNINTSGQQQREIVAMDYVPEVYDDTVSVPDTGVDDDPNYVNDLKATEVTITENGLNIAVVNLEWKGLGFFSIYQREGVDGAWEVVDATTNTTYTVRGLESGKTYYFAISVTNSPESCSVLNGDLVQHTFTGWHQYAVIWPVTGLQVDGQGNGETWQDRDLVLTWNLSTNVFPVEAGVEPIGAGTYPAMADFGGYRIQICNTDGTIRRQEYLQAAKYIYTYEMNNADGLSNIVMVKVWARDKYDNESAEPAIITAVNPAPAAPTGISATAFYKTIEFTWLPNSEIDFKKYQYRFKVATDDWGNWVDTTDTAARRTLTDAEIATHGQEDTTVYIEIRAVDTFGSTSGASAGSGNTTTLSVNNTDIEDFAVSATKLFTNAVVIEGDNWLNNDPSAGYVSWNEHTLVYGGEKYTIQAGNTNEKYIYWLNSSTSYTSSDTHPIDAGILNTNDFIIATNVNGNVTFNWNAIANQVIGSAYIMNAAIQTAHIQNAAIQTAQIDDAAIINAKIANATIEYAKIKSVNADTITTGTLSADRIAAESITTGLLAEDVTARMFSDDTKSFTELSDTDHIVQTFIQTTPPTSGMGIGDMWINTATGYVYEYDGSDWVQIQDQDIAAAIIAAADAQSTADSKIKTFFQPTMPTGADIVEGYLWFDTDDNNKPYRCDGTTYIEAPYDVADWELVYGSTKPEDNALVDDLLSKWVDDFDTDSTPNWTLTNCTMGVVPANSFVQLTTTDADPTFSIDEITGNFPETGIQGSVYQYIVFRYRVVSGTPAADSEVTWKTVSHEFDEAGYSKKWTPDADGLFHTTILDMHSLDIGGTDWFDNIIHAVEFHPCSNTGVVMEFDYIAVATKTQAMDWRATEDTSYMDGGKIFAGSQIILKEGGSAIFGDNNFIFDTIANAFYIGPDGFGGPGTADANTPMGLFYTKLDQTGLKPIYWDGLDEEEYDVMSRLESGIADHGDTVIIPGVWEKQPKIIVTPANPPMYDATYSAQDQSLMLDAINILKSETTGLWQFDIESGIHLTSNVTIYDLDLAARTASTCGNFMTTKTKASQSLSPTPSTVTKVKVKFRIKTRRCKDVKSNPYSAASKTRHEILIDGVSQGYSSYNTIKYDQTWNTYTRTFSWNSATDNTFQVNVQSVYDASYALRSGGILSPCVEPQYCDVIVQLLEVTYYLGSGDIPLISGTAAWLAIGR